MYLAVLCERGHSASDRAPTRRHEVSEVQGKLCVNITHARSAAHVLPTRMGKCAETETETETTLIEYNTGSIVSILGVK